MCPCTRTCLWMAAYHFLILYTLVKKIRGPLCVRVHVWGVWARRCVWPAESHMREKPWDSGWSHAIFYPGARRFCTAGVTAALEAWVLGDRVPLQLRGRYTHQSPACEPLHNPQPRWSRVWSQTSKFANCRGSAVFLPRRGRLKFPRREIQSLSNQI